MKVLITTDWYKPVINGVVTSVLSLADGLTALGHEVRILTLSGNRHSRVDGPVTYIGSVGVGKIYPNARLKTAPSGKYIRALVDWHPDVIHSQCEFSTFFLARKIAEECACPLVHTYHTVYEDFTHYFSPSVRFGRVMAAVFSRKILARTQTVVVPTAKVRDMLRRYGVQTPITVIPSGLELEQFETPQDTAARNSLRAALGLAADDQVLLYLGRLAKEKSIDELLELLTRQDDPRLRLLLVGDGPYRAHLEARVKDLQLGDRVIFAGMVPPSEVARYYNLGDIFVSASRSETQGLTYIEAMAAGLPLLCREDPCLNEALRDGVNGLTYHGEEDFGTLLRRLLAEDDFRRALGAAARETVFELYSSPAFAGHALTAYKQLLWNTHPELSAAVTA